MTGGVTEPVKKKVKCSKYSTWIKLIIFNFWIFFLGLGVIKIEA